MNRVLPGVKMRHFVILIAVVVVAAGLFLTFATLRARPGSDVISAMTPFVGEALEASGVSAVSGTDGVLIVDNGRNGQVFWMKLDEKGKQIDPIKPISLGINIEDIEGITTDGNYFYVVSSQSRPRAIAGSGLVRFKFDAHRMTVSDVVAINGLKQFLVENVAELRQEGERKSKDGGLNIEGLAWDPRQSRLLLGLRSPIVQGHALLVPIKLRDPRGAFSTNNLVVEGGKAIRLSLGGIGVRSIEYDPLASNFLVISGAAEDQTQTDFGLWEWNGDPQRPALREAGKFEKRLKPEGVAAVKVGSGSFVIVTYDAGGYTTLGHAQTPKKD